MSFQDEELDEQETKPSDLPKNIESKAVPKQQ